MASFPDLSSLRYGWLAATLLLCAPAHAVEPTADPETALQQIIEEIRANRLDQALVSTDRLIDAFPNFRLAHLIRGDLLTARVRPIDSIGGVQGISGATLNGLRAEALARLRARDQRPQPNQLPRDLLALAPEQGHAVLVDTAKSRLYVFRNDHGSPRLIADYYVSQGKEGAEKWREGDKRTPLGVYFVTAAIPPKRLPAFYGSGAFPINYPNEWDRRLGRSGYGIWLHGTPPDTYARPPLASDGCVVLANQDLDALSGFVEPGQTPVVIGQQAEWVSPEAWRRERARVVQVVESWRQDWESRDTARYLRHYASDFRSGDHDLDAWRRQRERFNGTKQWASVSLAQLSIFRSPGRDNVIVVSFELGYRSNDLNTTIKKRQYWHERDGDWKIVYEGPA
ncbi:MAG: L,D-transpeptidase [Rhodocyclaceae bacterium]|nr:L,D-transpeptidase [Rhodocyclaceae bacterium]